MLIDSYVVFHGRSMTKHKLSGYASMLTRKARRRSLFLFMISAKARRIRNLTSEPTRGEDGSCVLSELDRGNRNISGNALLRHVFKLLGFELEIAINNLSYRNTMMKASAMFKSWIDFKNKYCIFFPGDGIGCQPLNRWSDIAKANIGWIAIDCAAAWAMNWM